ncbi:hypothetical protein C0J52_25964 [Blattella germanica]|nr:hypothetical protein C0J52_25964 [Blattella germanica]
MMHSKMVDMNEIQVSRAVGLREQGWTYRQIAADLNFSVSGICRAIKRHRETGLYKRRQGQERASTQAYEDVIIERRQKATAVPKEIMETDAMKTDEWKGPNFLLRHLQPMVSTERFAKTRGATTTPRRTADADFATISFTKKPCCGTSPSLRFFCLWLHVDNLSNVPGFTPIDFSQFRYNTTIAGCHILFFSTTRVSPAKCRLNALLGKPELSRGKRELDSAAVNEKPELEGTTLNKIKGGHVFSSCSVYSRVPSVSSFIIIEIWLECKKLKSNIGECYLNILNSKLMQL